MELVHTETRVPTIEYKTRPCKVWDAGGVDYRLAIDWKRRLHRADCNLRPQDHTYYNSDLFEGMLNSAYRRIIGEYATWCYLDELPVGVTVDTSKFLAVVRIALPLEFR